MKPPYGANTVVMVMAGPIVRGDVAALCECVRVLLADGVELVVCDVGALTDPDLATVDALARLQLTARRLGGRVQVRRPCPELQSLLALAGLSEVVPLSAGSGLEPGGQAEKRE